MYPRRQQQRSGLMRCATHTHTKYSHIHQMCTHSFRKHTSMAPRGQSVKESVHLNYKIHSFLLWSLASKIVLVLFLKGFEIVGCNISSSTPVQWKWMGFYCGASSIVFQRKSVFYQRVWIIQSSQDISGVEPGFEPQHFLVPTEMYLLFALCNSEKCSFFKNSNLYCFHLWYLTVHCFTLWDISVCSKL